MDAISRPQPTPPPEEQSPSFKQRAAEWCLKAIFFITCVDIVGWIVLSRPVIVLQFLQTAIAAAIRRKVDTWILVRLGAKPDELSGFWGFFAFSFLMTLGVDHILLHVKPEWSFTAMNLQALREILL